MITFTCGKRSTLHAATINALTEFRSDVFIRRLQWRLQNEYVPGVDADQFDTDQTVYVLAQSPNGTVYGCARLLPTTLPYLLKDVFGHLLPDRSAPRSSDVWELSRFAADVARAPGVEGSLGRSMFAESLRVARHHGARKIVGVVSARMKSFILRLGVPLVTLGPVMESESGGICACELEVEASLTRLASGETAALGSARQAQLRRREESLPQRAAHARSRTDLSLGTMRMIRGAVTFGVPRANAQQTELTCARMDALVRR